MTTLGLASLGNANSTGDGGVNAFYIGQMPADGVVSAMSLGAQGFFGAANAKLGLYTGTSSAPTSALLAEGSVTFADGTNSIESVTGLSVSLTSGAHVWVACLDSGTPGGVSYSRDTTTGVVGYRQKNATYPTFPNPFGTSDYDDTRVQRTAFITYGTSDSIAPSLSTGLTVNSVTSAGFDVLGTPDEGGTVSLLVVAIGATASTDGQFDASAETAAMTAGTQFTIHHTGQ